MSVIIAKMTEGEAKNMLDKLNNKKSTLEGKNEMIGQQLLALGIDISKISAKDAFETVKSESAEATEKLNAIIKELEPHQEEIEGLLNG